MAGSWYRKANAQRVGEGEGEGQANEDLTTNGALTSKPKLRSDPSKVETLDNVDLACFDKKRSMNPCKTSTIKPVCQ